MPTFTPNINLKKPLQTENYNVDDFNGNCDLIDTKIKSIDDKILVINSNKTDKSWKPSKSFLIGGICYSSNYTDSYKLMECTKAGTSGVAEPVWPAVGQTIADGTAIWTIRAVRDADTVDGKHASDFAPSGYGLGISKILSSISLNTAMSSGFYYASSCTNIPTDGVNGHLLCMGDSINVVWQRYTNAGSGIGYERSYQGGNWSAWEQVATMSKVITSGTGWTKYADGTMIQEGSGVTGANGVLTITFPLAFYDNSYKVTVSEADTSGWGSTYLSIYGTGSHQANQMQVVGRKIYVSSIDVAGSAGMLFHYICKGRWKA